MPRADRRPATCRVPRLTAGYAEEAEAWRSWVVRAVAGSASQVQLLYSLSGENRNDEWEIEWLARFNGAQPVRAGNLAFQQRQFDSFGEILDVLHQARMGSLEPDHASWGLQRALLGHFETLVDVADHGIWETRDRPRHFTHSKVMMWVAFDRGLRGVEEFGLQGPAAHWRRLRDRLHAEICANAFDHELGAFVRAYDERELDAATLLMPLVGFLPATDPRMVGTVEAIRRRLTIGDFIRRYDTRTAQDGLPPGEGLFLACNFWLAGNPILQGRIDEGRALFERLLDTANDVGLMAEEHDATTGTQLGNFPQALSHLAQVGTAYNLAGTGGPAHQRSRPGRK